MKRLSFVSMLSFLIMSCVGGIGSPIQRKAVFNDDEYLPYSKPGKAVITGQAFATTQDGKIHCAAGRTIYLNPATTYATEYFNLQVGEGESLSEPDQRFLNFEKKTVSDPAGNFAFRNLPAGKYYIATDLSWSERRIPHHVILGALVEARDGEVTKVILPVVRSRLFGANGFQIGAKGKERGQGQK